MTSEWTLQLSVGAKQRCQTVLIALLIAANPLEHAEIRSLVLTAIDRSMHVSGFSSILAVYVSVISGLLI